MYNNLFEILGCASSKKVSEGTKTAEVRSWYEKNTRKFQIVFWDAKYSSTTACKYAVNSVSEKRVVKEVNNFLFIEK